MASHAHSSPAPQDTGSLPHEGLPISSRLGRSPSLAHPFLWQALLEKLGGQVAALTLNAEAELLLLVGDVAGHSTDESHGQRTGHTGDGACLH